MSARKMGTKEKAALYDHLRAEVRQLTAVTLLHELNAHGFHVPDDETFEAFARDWRPLAFVPAGGQVHVVDAERVAEIACGYAWDLGAAQAEIERMRERLARYEGLKVAT